MDHLVPINNICQQKCNFCSAEFRMIWNTPIPLKQVFSQILQKWDYIQISGWEPLLHPQLYTILYFVRKQKPNCFLEFQSNALLLMKNNNLQKLMKFRVNLFNINYPSHIEEINDIIVWIPNTLKIREEAMHEIIKIGWNLRVNIIINTMNYTTFPETINHLYRNFKWLERIQLSFTKAMWAANKNDEVVPKYEDVEKYFIQAIKIWEEYGLHIDIDHIPMCFLWKYFTHHIDYHKIQKWEKWVFFTEKHYVQKCQKCDLKNLCAWYRKDYLEIYPENIYV